MDSLFSFPTFAQMYPVEKRKLKRLRESLRYFYRTVLYSKQCGGFVDFVNQRPLWSPIFIEVPYRVNTLLTTYCDKRFSPQQRLEAIQQNFVLAEQYWGTDFCKRLLDQKSLLLGDLTEDLGLYLNINEIDPLEGFFSLNLKYKQSQERVYDASFGFLEPNKLLIASIQGPNHQQAQDVVRLATKQLHGTRPMFMLVNGFKVLAQQLSCELVGIPHKKQAKYRFNDSARLLFNYDVFWQENGGVLSGEYWQLPTQIERKSLDEIPSKKRAMYRKRFEMFDQLIDSINSIWISP